MKASNPATLRNGPAQDLGLKISFPAGNLAALTGGHNR
jgi:hypothetical protein